MRPPRLQRFTYRGIYAYFLTLCTWDRRPLFDTEANVGSVLSQFRQCAQRWDFSITAYCFMPDHVHFLVTGRTDRARLREFVEDAKQRSGFAFKRRGGLCLWQEGYYDHVLRTEEERLPVVRYLMNNPLRKGLCATIAEYRFCGSDEYSLEQIAEGLQTWTPPWRG